MKQFTLILTLLLLGIIISISSSGGRSGAWSNAPGDNGYCNACHTTSGVGSIALTGAPTSYIAGQTYNMTLTLNQAVGVVGGFQIVATNGTNNTNIGTFAPASDQGINDINRLVQTTPKSFSLGQVSWPISWTAPVGGAPANVQFYFAGNAANGNGGSGAGDISFAGSTGLIPLPVELSNFSAHHKKGQGNIIRWTTESQTNLDRFELLSSTNAKDFSLIHSLKGEENTSSFTSYSYIDDVNKDVVFYKLHMIDFDGKHEYSDIISVTAKKERSIKLSPNPIFSSQPFYLSHDYSNSDPVHVQIISLTGQILGAKKYTIESNNRVEIQPRDFNLTEGQYVLQLTDNKGIVESMLFQVQ